MTHENEALDLRINSALERTPEIEISADFALRVASRVPKRRVAALPLLRGTRFGYGAIAASLLILLVAMMLLAPRAASFAGYGAIFWTALEWTLCGQFVVLAMWLGVWRRQA